MATKESLQDFKIDATPSADILRQLWRHVESDPLRPMLLADTTAFLSPQHFLAAVGNTILPFVAFVDGEPAVLAWLYDVAMVPPKMTPISAFLALYVVALFRQQQVWQQCADEFLTHVRSYGLAHLWAEVRVDNLASQYALRASGFEQVATLPSWKRYQGEWHDMKLYHLSLAHIADVKL